MIVIQSKANALVKQTKKLNQKKYRKDSYLIEGWHLLEEAIAAKATLRRVFTLECYKERCHDIKELVLVSEEVLRELSDSPTPQGVIAEVEMPSNEWDLTTLDRLLVLEDVQDPGNLGTMVRTADAAGFDAVILSDKSADIYNPKTLRSMQGSHFHLTIYRRAMSELLQELKQREVSILATTLSEVSVDYREVSPKVPFALVMGNEGKGISQSVIEASDKLLHIPMYGQAESLNVAVAAGILMFRLL
ncbi:TrmH family RNA methyltransferase [Streptococcus sp. zg-JUN1979]|uniref:TrmH family RNA methyltransferase n=1 Tax=Streptococcus sp. zg-JUN1979 TaxID=3391450 RepID=UPI0039A52A67